jgi:hypothetical protein
MSETIIEFIILIPYKDFIIHANFLKNLSSKHRETRPFGVAFVIREPVSGIPDADRMRHGGSHGLPKIASALADNGAASATDLGMFFE